MSIISWVLRFPPLQWATSTLNDALITALRQGPIPTHVAFVCDGNRRYAKTHGMETSEGHSQGFESLKKILEVCLQLNVKVVTVYAFSIENFKRPKWEVDALMDIAKSALAQLGAHGDLADRYGVSVRILGETSLVPPDVLEAIEKVTEQTKHNKKAILNVCFPYTSQSEITHAVRTIVSASTSPSTPIDPESITESTISSHLFTHDCPPLDLLVRTSGVTRMSDFMLWQTGAETMVKFIDCFWPEFNLWRFLPVLVEWQMRVKGVGLRLRKKQA